MKTRLMLLCLACALLLAGCARKGDAPQAQDYEDYIVVGFSQVGAESDWRKTNTRSMQEALSEKNGFRLIFDDSQQKQERQITAIRNFIQQEVDYIVLAPNTETGWTTVLAEAKAAGIPVIIVDRRIDMADEDLITCWVGSDFRKEGNTAVTWMEQCFGDRPLKIVHLQGNIGPTAQIGRTNALNAGLAAHPNWELVYRAPADYTQAKGQELVEQLIRDGVTFDVLYAENDNMAYGAIDALKAAGIQPGVDVTIISFDANRAALQLILDGEISLDVECNPLHGPRVQAIIEQLEAGKTPPKFTFVEETAFDAETLTPEIVAAREY